jgi:hypothetical protein
MHRRHTLTQRDGPFCTLRFILYGNRVRVIRQSLLRRDDQYVPLSAIDPERLVVRQAEPRRLLGAAALASPGLLVIAGLAGPLPTGLPVASLGLAVLGLISFVPRGWPGRTWVRHGALQLLADRPDANRFRAFESHLVEASRACIVSEEEEDGLAGGPVASEIRRLHAHQQAGHISPPDFARHKQRLLRSLGESGR